ncbi:MAG: DUF6122 family protein [Kangiellaceae bacterium]|jgi:hypothetical protein|nr:DUF6122 family protein [Kangiellaceae bacterium]
MLHIALHIIVPLFVGLLVFRKQWRLASAIMLATMLVDLDHLFAEPIYDPQRCSINFHPLHRLELILLYVTGCLFRPTRLIATGLVIHMLLDSIDCQVNQGVWYTPPIISWFATSDTAAQ